MPLMQQYKWEDHMNSGQRLSYTLASNKFGDDWIKQTVPIW